MLLCSGSSRSPAVVSACTALATGFTIARLVLRWWRSVSDWSSMTGGISLALGATGKRTGSEMGARRCSPCGISYPVTEPLKICPACFAETDLLGNAMPDADWKQRAADAHYRYHESERKAPDPEEIGRQQARTILEHDWPTPELSE